MTFIWIAPETTLHDPLSERLLIYHRLQPWTDIGIGARITAQRKYRYQRR